MLTSKILKYNYKFSLFRTAMESDRHQVLNFLQKHYYPNEPTSLENEPGYENNEDAALMLSYIPYGTSIIALDNNKKLIGAMITGPLNSDDGEKLIEQSKRTTSKEWAQDLQLTANLRDNFNIHKHFNVSKVLHVHATAVDRNIKEVSIKLRTRKEVHFFGKVIGLSSG